MGQQPCAPLGAAKGAVQALEQRAEAGGDYDTQALGPWRERLRQAEQVEDEAIEEPYNTPTFNHVAHHDLDAFSPVHVGPPAAA